MHQLRRFAAEGLKGMSVPGQPVSYTHLDVYKRQVQACDLRAGAALVIAGLAARGVTELSQVQFIERGYEDLVGKLLSLIHI